MKANQMRQRKLRSIKLFKKQNHMKHFDKAVLIAVLAFGTHSTLVARNLNGGGRPKTS